MGGYLPQYNPGNCDLLYICDKFRMKPSELHEDGRWEGYMNGESTLERILLLVATQVLSPQDKEAVLFKFHLLQATWANGPCGFATSWWTTWGNGTLGGKSCKFFVHVCVYTSVSKIHNLLRSKNI